MGRLNNEIFINRANVIHNYKFGYTNVDYINSYTKVEIICPTHGIFTQEPGSHLMGQGCAKCAKDYFKSNTKDFIEKAKKIHGDTYIYDLVNYEKSNINVDIICPTHGVFSQTPSNHLIGHGCQKCKFDNKRNNTYIDKCNEKFNFKFDYSKVNYINNKINVDIICPTHGLFQQNMKGHFNSKYGCPYCAKKKMNTELFIEQCSKKHNNFFDYSKVVYISAFEKVDIICPSHGLFQQTASVHLFGAGCPKCKASKGEKSIITYLDGCGIVYETQYRFDECKNVLTLPFDFYIPSKNMCLEFNGPQHYDSYEYFGGEEAFKKRQMYDNIKIDFCNNNDIKIEIISFEEDIIKRLDEIFQ